MLNTNARNFRSDIYNILEQTIKYNEPVNTISQEKKTISGKDDPHETDRPES